MSNEPIPGMQSSDRCSFCREFGDKSIPYVCELCYEQAMQLQNTVRDRKEQQLLDIVERLTFTNWMLTRTPKWQPTHICNSSNHKVRMLHVALDEIGDAVVVFDLSTGEVRTVALSFFYGEFTKTTSLGTQRLRNFEPIEAKDQKEEVVQPEVYAAGMETVSTATDNGSKSEPQSSKTAE